MQVTLKSISDNVTKLTISANAADLASMKHHVVEKLAPRVSVPGFRKGKVPLEIVEKQLDPNTLQAEVLDEAINHYYGDAVAEKQLRVVSQPKVELTKFVPFTELEFTAEVEVIAKITLPDYKKITVKKPVAKVSASDVKEVLGRLQSQAADYTEVERAAKSGDRAFIDFAGKDANGEPIANADGKDYPLALGSNTFIPGFEDNVIGLKKGDTKEFTIPFPKDYGVKALQGKKVTFTVTVNKIEETKLDELNDAFAAKVGPFKTVDELKADIEKQLGVERERQAQQEFENLIIKELIGKTKVKLPEALLAEQVEIVDREFKQNLSYRGETFQEYLKNSGLSEEEYTEKELKPAAEERLKAGLVLSEIAEAEKLTVTPEELEIRMQIMKGQYTDPQMQAELEKPEARRDIASRLLTEKTIAKLVGYAK
jgi:trigger factor